MTGAVIGRRSAPRLALLLTLATIVAVALVRPGGEADAKPAPKPEFFGIVPTSIQPGDFEKMAELGIHTLRYGFYWPAIEPTPGSYEWDSYDHIFREATAAGVRVFPTLLGTPGWVNFLAGRNGCGSICAPESTASRNAFAAFAKAAVERYGPEGDFWNQSGGDCGVPTLCPYEPAACECTKPLPVRSWQIWNEQNSSKYYAPKPAPTAYAGIVSTVGAAIKSVDPRADIVLGGMWGPPDTDAVVPTVEYLKQLYAVPNVADTFDSISVHPYAPTFGGVKSQMTRVRKAVSRFGDPNVRTWVTELGWASGGPKNEGLVKTVKGQARMLTQSVEYLIERRAVWRLRGVNWYTWRDAGAAGESDCEWCPQAGLLTNDGTVKRSGRALKRIALGR